MNFKAVRVTAVFAGLLAIVGGVPAQAHHSFTSTYDVNQVMTIQGTVLQFLFRNPHSFVHMMAADKSGKMNVWAVEWAGGAALGGAAVTHTTLRPGDKIIVTGNPARDMSLHRLRMRAIVRPSDGWKWEGTFG
jgi:hypothetical protein